MKTNFIYISILYTILISACSKDKALEQIETHDSPDYPNYSKHNVGNYWIYQHFNVDTNGNAIPKDKFDSCYVQKDTIINNKKYFKIIRPNPFQTSQVSIERDSLHYIVNNYGEILFSSQDFTTLFRSYYEIAPFNDTICYVRKKMDQDKIVTTVPAGNFLNINSQEVFTMYPSYSNAGKQRTKNIRYAKNVGIILETLPFFLSNPNYIEKRLVRYSVE